MKNEEKQHLTFLTRIAYGSGDVACNIVVGTISALLIFFYTDYVGVSAATVGLVMLISRIFDGCSDVIMGFFVSKTKSKYGQSRPWLLWMSVPFAVSAVLLFLVPQNAGMLQAIYIFVTYNFCTTVCYTAVNLPYGSLSAMMTRDSYERDILSVFRIGMSQFGKIIAVTFTLPLVKLFGNTQAAWIKCIILWSILALLLILFCFAFCKETVPIQQQMREHIPIGKMLKAIAVNQYFWAVLLLWMFQCVHQTVIGTVLPYYCKYIFHNDSWMYSALYLTETLVIIICVFLCPLLLSRFGKRNLVLLGAAIAVIGQALFFLNPTSFFWCMATTIIRSIGEAPLNAFIFGMIGDTVEFGQWKTHLRQESFIFAGGSVGTKLGSGIASAGITGIMSLFGYISSTGQNVVQPDSAIASIRNMYQFIPLLIWACVLVVAIFYQLDRQYPAIMEELAARERRGEL